MDVELPELNIPSRPVTVEAAGFVRLSRVAEVCFCSSILVIYFLT